MTGAVAASMKMGLILEHYAGRNDIREFVELLARLRDIVIFAPEATLRTIDAPVEKRAFREGLSLRQRAWLQLFNIIGAVPRSHENFLVTEIFKLSALPHWHRRLATARLRLRLALPRPMTFDFLLDRLAGSDVTEIDDIDRFLIITELTSPAFLAHVLGDGKAVDAYVYSWDHPCKHTKVSQRVRRWFVWHEGIRDDLVRLQGIDATAVSVVGATQLAYVREYLHSPDLRVRKRPGRYIYYGCGTGHPAMAEQEARVIGVLADALLAVDRNMMLLVRPYPFLAGTTYFRDLASRANVELDVDYRFQRSDNSLRRSDIFERLNLQEHSVAFAHCGTTMGLEGAYLPAPILFLDLVDIDYGVSAGEFLHLQKFVRQYHNQRYMILRGFPNVVRSREQLEPVLRRVLKEPAAFTAYNASIAAAMPLRSLPEIASHMLEMRTGAGDGIGTMTEPPSVRD